MKPTRSSVLFACGIIGLVILLFLTNSSNKVLFAADSFTPSAVPETTKKTLNDKIKEIVSNAIKDENATRVSVYFESSTTNESIAVNDTETYSPASMDKVILMIAFLKLTEQNSNLAKRKVLPEQISDYVIEQEYQPKEKLQKNTYYSLEELNKRMIIYSDNEAYMLLAQTLQLDNLDVVTQQLGLNVRESFFNYMRPSEFAKVYKSLSSASYLSKNNSYYALDLLSKTTFNDGLTAGLPINLIVAHKFGERGTNKSSQLHDCGIVFYPGNPYVLCVMTEGKTLERLSKVIADISYTVYSDMERKDKQFLLESAPSLLLQ